MMAERPAGFLARNARRDARTSGGFAALAVAGFLFLKMGALGATLEVGPGMAFSGIEEALAQAKPGDTVRVHPLPEGKAYRKVALMVRTANLTLQGVPEKKGDRIRLDGQGYDYSGAGPVPRAIIQFNPRADGCVLEGFELFNAHNDSNNGAGVRINTANGVTIRSCDIHDNDMGIMSNGKVSDGTGALQRIEFCRIHSNGSLKDPGYNHNLYLGGTSAILHACEVFGSLTGHNVKSRAHYNRVEYCYVHDSANREFDLVDEKGNTDVPESHAVLLGNIIVKKPDMTGNKGGIHFGKDGAADHRGTIYLIQNTIITPYQMPVLDLSAAGAGAAIVNNLFWDLGSGNHVLVAVRNGAEMRNISGNHNFLAPGFSLTDTLKGNQNVIAPKPEAVTFAEPPKGVWHLRAGDAAIGTGLPWAKLSFPLAPGENVSQGPLKLFEYSAPCGVAPRSDGDKPSLGASEIPPPKQ